MTPPLPEIVDSVPEAELSTKEPEELAEVELVVVELVCACDEALLVDVADELDGAGDVVV